MGQNVWSIADREVVISRLDSRISIGARSGARWPEAVGVIISRKRSFLRSLFSQNLKCIDRKLSELVEAYVA